jgi:cold shock CspA family protein
MSRGKPGLSDTERELFGKNAAGGYVRPPIKEVRLPKTERAQAPSAPATVTAPQPTDVPEITEPASMQIVTPVETGPPEPTNATNQRTGRIRAVYHDRDCGFIRLPDDDRDIYFNNKTCFGHLRALRSNDEVTFLLEEGAKGPWARRVDRTWPKQA